MTLGKILRLRRFVNGPDWSPVGSSFSLSLLQSQSSKLLGWQLQAIQHERTTQHNPHNKLRMPLTIRSSSLEATKKTHAASMLCGLLQASALLHASRTVTCYSCAATPLSLVEDLTSNHTTRLRPNRVTSTLAQCKGCL